MITTQQILSMAYADVFGIEANADGRYFDQTLNDFRSGKEITIDYAHFDDNLNKQFDMDEDHIEAVTEDGSEGV